MNLNDSRLRNSGTVLGEFHNRSQITRLRLSDLVDILEQNFPSNIYYLWCSTFMQALATGEIDELNLSGCSWDDWSEVVDWDALSVDNNDYHHHLIQSMVDDDMAIDETFTDNMLTDEDTNHKTFKGLRVVHLLMAAAEALAGEHTSHDLARVILIRLKDLVSNDDQTNIERLASYFCDALYGLLESNGIVHGKQLVGNDEHKQMDLLAAFQLLQDMSPCLKFGHFTANQAILEAVVYDRRIHIVDYDIMEGIQWASLMQSLVTRKEGALVPHLKITAISRSGCGRRSIGTIQETSRRLISFAASIGQPFSFHQCKVGSDEIFRPSDLKLVKEEALVVNCMLHLPHSNCRTADSVISFLSGVKALNPRVVTMVEEVAESKKDGGFVGQFMDSLHHYSALYDSLEAGFPMQSRARALVEKVIIGPQIAGTLAQMYCTRGVKNRSRWWEWLVSVGYRGVNISFANNCQAKLLLGLFNDGYKVEELGQNKLILGWKSRQLLCASVWNSGSDSDL